MSRVSPSRSASLPRRQGLDGQSSTLERPVLLTFVVLRGELPDLVPQESLVAHAGACVQPTHPRRPSSGSADAAAWFRSARPVVTLRFPIVWISTTQKLETPCVPGPELAGPGPYRARSSPRSGVDMEQLVRATAPGFRRAPCSATASPRGPDFVPTVGIDCRTSRISRAR